MLTAGISMFFVKMCWKTEHCLYTRKPTADYLILKLLLKSLKQGTVFKTTGHDICRGVTPASN